MTPEMEPSKVVTEQIATMRVGLSEADIALLERDVEEGRIKNVSWNTVKRVRGAAAFLSGAQLGIQWQDFHNQTDPVVRSNRDFYLEQRSLVLDTLYPIVFPGKTSILGRLPLDEAIKVQRAISSFKEVLNNFCEGMMLDYLAREVLRNAVHFFKEFGIKEMHATRKGS